MTAISYGILTHNEDDSLKELLDLLVTHLRQEDEIVIVDDFSDNLKTLNILKDYSSLAQVKLYKRHLNNNFAQQKNFLNQHCSKNYIFNLDADELPSLYLLQEISYFLSEYPDVDLFWLPRVNIIDNLTKEYLKKNNWFINNNSWINWPDYQGRIYKNKAHIRWTKKVHESIAGFYKSFYLPEDKNYALWHKKTLQKQSKQNSFYKQLSWSKTMIKKGLRLLFLQN